MVAGRGGGLGMKGLDEGGGGGGEGSAVEKNRRE